MIRRLVVSLAVGLASLPPLPAGAATRSAHHRHHAAAASANPVILTQQPGTALDAAARQLNAEDLAGATKRGETPVVLIGSAPLAAGGHGEPALFVQLQSASLCGSAGCSTSVYLHHDGAWSKVLDSVSGPIKVLPGSAGGMHDLMVGDKDRWTWFGSAYHDTLPAAPIGNLKGAVERHQAEVRHQEGG